MSLRALHIFFFPFFFAKNSSLTGFDEVCLSLVTDSNLKNLYGGAINYKLREYLEIAVQTLSFIFSTGCGR